MLEVDVEAPAFLSSLTELCAEHIESACGRRTSKLCRQRPNISLSIKSLLAVDCCHHSLMRRSKTGRKCWMNSLFSSLMVQSCVRNEKNRLGGFVEENYCID